MQRLEDRWGLARKGKGAGVAERGRDRSLPQVVTEEGTMGDDLSLGKAQALGTDRHW